MVKRYSDIYGAGKTYKYTSSLEWKLELYDDLVIISTFRNEESYAWGSIHLDAFYRSRKKNWYKELIEKEEVTVSFDGFLR